jgi:hypothetical protein
MKIAVETIVQNGKSVAEAAVVAGLHKQSIKDALKENPAVREFYTSEIRALCQRRKGQGRAHAYCRRWTALTQRPALRLRAPFLRTTSERLPASTMPEVPGFANSGDGAARS